MYAMSSRSLVLFIQLFFILLLPVRSALGFSCNTTSVTVSVPVSTFTSSGKGTVFTLPSAVIPGCNGRVDSMYKDAMRVRSVMYDSSLSTFSRLLQVTGGSSSTSTGMTAIGSAQTISSSNLCVWPDNSCSTSNYSGTKNTLPIYIKLTGDAVELASGTVLATVILERRSTTAFNAETYTITYKLAGKVEPPVYTCSITDYDASVTLASVSRDDIVNNGAGHYSSITKPLNLNLQCNDNTDVTIKFTATAMSGTDNVIKNNEAGNDNVGFQLFYGGNPVKLNDDKVLLRASGTTHLTFDTYYYYRGSGAIVGGPIKSSAEFLFTYK
ncbi:fimbrial protein [Escherichia coli]|nr:fimbrial protein [Escherichia coli]